MSFFLPFIYLVVGIIIGKQSLNTDKLRKILSKILTVFIVPIVIIWNLSVNFHSMWIFIVGIATIMVLIIFINNFFKVNSIYSLSFCYLNIGWLGLPISNALFGHNGDLVFIGLYVGSSIIGNSIGALILSKQKLNLKQFLIAPPVIALLIGILLIPWRSNIKELFPLIYNIAKVLMSLLGMGVLGMWLVENPFNLKDMFKEIKLSLFRSLVLFIIISIVVYVGYSIKNDLIKNNISVLYLLCLLPPAANIPVLETHYVGTGTSANLVLYGTIVSIFLIGIYAIILKS